MLYVARRLNPKLDRDSGQAGDRVGLEFPEDLRAMELDRSLPDVQVGRHLLIELAAHQVRKDFSLTRGEPIEMMAEPLAMGSGVPIHPVLGEGAGDRVDQRLRLDRLGEEVDGAALDGAYRIAHLAIAGQEDDGQRILACRDHVLQIQPARTGQPHVEDDTAGGVGFEAGQKVVGARGGPHLESGGPEQSRHRLGRWLVVVDDIDDW